MAIEIVDLPVEKMVMFQSCLYVYHKVVPPSHMLVYKPHKNFRYITNKKKHSELLELHAPECDFENSCPTVYFPQPSRSTRCPKPRHPNQAHLAGDHVQDED